MAPHHRLIVEKLEAVENGSIRRLGISCPPRVGKSVFGSQFFPAWALGRDPYRQILLGSYGAELAEDHGRRARNLVADPLSEAIFPECRIAPDSSAAHRFSTTVGGLVYSVGRGGSATGRGASIAIIDDPLKDLAEANSDATIRELHDWFKAVVLTRLAPDGRVIVISTRWTERDLLGSLEGRTDWEIVNLPAISEGEGDPLGRPEGAPLWPERFPRDVLERIKSEIGSHAWNALYQGKPTAAEGELFKRGWWRYFDGGNPPTFTRTIFSLDTAFSTKTSADFSVCTVWSEGVAGFYLRHVWRERADFPTLRRAVEDLAALWNPNAVVIEQAASGQSLLQTFEKETRLPIKAIKVATDKTTRAQGILPLIESGRVFLPTGAPWLGVYVDELAGFPRTKHDDQTDSTTMALEYLRGTPKPGPFMFASASPHGHDLSGEWRRYF